MTEIIFFFFFILKIIFGQISLTNWPLRREVTLICVTKAIVVANVSVSIKLSSLANSQPN